MSRRPQVDPAIRELLDASGRSWTLEQGSKHNKLKVDGHLVLVIPHMFYRDGSGTAAKNALAAVRKHLRSVDRLEEDRRRLAAYLEQPL